MFTNEMRSANQFTNLEQSKFLVKNTHALLWTGYFSNGSEIIDRRDLVKDTKTVLTGYRELAELLKSGWYPVWNGDHLVNWLEHSKIEHEGLTVIYTGIWKLEYHSDWFDDPETPVKSIPSYSLLDAAWDLIEKLNRIEFIDPNDSSKRLTGIFDPRWYAEEFEIDCDTWMKYGFDMKKNSLEWILNLI